MKRLDKSVSRDIAECVRRLYEAQQSFKKTEKWYAEVKKKEQLAISNFMFQFCDPGEKSFQVELKEGMEYYTDHKKLSVAKVRKQKVVFDLAKLKQKLTKKKYRSIVNREYIISDYEGLTQYLKECGVEPKKFKSFICVEETLDETRLECESGRGNIKQSDLVGCYRVEQGEPYIKITELKKDDTQV